MELGRLGVWYPTDRLDGPQLAALMTNIEGHGYSAFWYPESRGYESLSLAGFLLGASKRLMIGSSIANIYARDALASRGGMITLNKLYGNRFILGLGVSHQPSVEGVRGHRYEKPLPAMRAYLNALQGPPGAQEAGATDWPVMIAALGPLMLKLTAARTKGALPYNVTPEHTAQAAALRKPGQWLAVEQKICIEPDRARARILGRAELSRYMVLPNYRNNWLRLGFTEAELENGGNDRFIDAMVISGSADEVRAGLRAHFTAGATHVCLQPVHAEGDWAHRDAMIAALADT